MRPRYRRLTVGAPGRVSPRLVRFSRRVLRPLMGLFHRPSLDGVEHLPDGPFLLVANHSAGMGISEILCFMALYLERYGDTRPLAGFAHPIGLQLYPASILLHSAGAIPSTYEDANAALAAGVPLLVFPGGDHETLRPIWQASRVDFGGRKGFLKIARQHRIPIVPMGITGSHVSAPVLWRSTHLLPNLLVLPRLFGFRRWAVTLLGALGAVGILAAAPWSWPLRALATWAWLTSPFMFLPFIPSTIRFRIGAPIPADELFGHGDDSDESLAPALARVEAAVQAIVTPR